MSVGVGVRLAITGDKKHVHVESAEELKQLLADPEAVVWMDVDKDELWQLDPYQEFLKLHPLAMEDAASPHQRPIINRYGPTFFLLLYELVVQNNGVVQAFPVSFFVGKNYVVTARDIERSSLDDVVNRWIDFGDDVSDMDSGFLLYVLLDAIVDRYFPAIEVIGDRLEELEDIIEATNEHHVQVMIHEARKRVSAIRRVISPGREVINELIRRDTPMINEETLSYFDDVYDHLLRVLDWLDSYRDLAGQLFEMQLAMSSLRLDRVMRTLTVASIVLMVGSLIAGIYGMNFRHMPELDWKYGYPLAILLMVVLDLSLVSWFKRKRWI